MASREFPYSFRRHLGSVINTNMGRATVQTKHAVTKCANSAKVHVTCLTARVHDITEVQQQLPKVDFDFGLNVDLAWAIDCLAEFRFERVPELFGHSELHVKISWVSAVHVNKWFEDRKKPRNVSISNLEVAM